MSGEETPPTVMGIRKQGVSVNLYQLKIAADRDRWSLRRLTAELQGYAGTFSLQDDRCKRRTITGFDNLATGVFENLHRVQDHYAIVLWKHFGFIAVNAEANAGARRFHSEFMSMVDSCLQKMIEPILSFDF